MIFLTKHTLLSRASAPVKASINALHLLAFTGGDFYGEYGICKCELFVFLDCGRTCPDSGTLSSDCMYCICSETISGQVLSNLGRPLINVTISPLSTDDVMATSDESGMFSIAEACSYETYTFSSSGFVSSDIIFDQQTSTNVTLDRIGNSSHNLRQ